MKQKLKDEIDDLLGKKLKKDMLLAFCREPGIYEVDGQKYNSKQFEALQKNYEKTLIFEQVKTKKP